MPARSSPRSPARSSPAGNRQRRLIRGRRHLRADPGGWLHTGDGPGPANRAPARRDMEWAVRVGHRGFFPDYNATGQGFIGAEYGASPSAPSTPTTTTSPSPLAAPTAKLTSIVVASGGKFTIKLSCPAGVAACAKDTVAVTVLEHLRGGRLTAVSAARGRRPRSSRLPADRSRSPPERARRSR